MAKNSRPTGKKLVVFLSICFIILAVSYVREIYNLPNQLTLFENQEYEYNFKSPFTVNIQADNKDMLIFESKDSKLGSSYYNLSDPIMFKAKKLGRVKLNMRLFGLIPLKTLQVDIVPYKELVACGNTIGVKLKIDGILVIGLSDIETINRENVLPAKESGIKTGDLIIEVNGKKVDSISDLQREVEGSNGESIQIKYKRNNTYNNTRIKPVISMEDNKYHLGMWVRDSTAGIGTLTFYDTKTNSFGALGHGITDIDTGILMPVEKGEIIESNILAIQKGRQGSPGELKGILIEDGEELGKIDTNCEYGIYGKLNEATCDKFPNKVYPIGLRNEVKVGPAVILANVDGKTVQEYAIEIVKLSTKSTSGSKGMIIKVTDKRLLEATGGIVQGMSGSPVIQDGKLVGAVTHVLVNDPTRGYGIFIEWMVRNIASEQVEKKVGNF